MTERDFVYWLRGFLELTDAEELSREQIKMIKEHLDLVMQKLTSPLTIIGPKSGPGFDPPIVTCTDTGRIC